MDPIAGIRKNYQMRSLAEADTAADPLEQFGRWWEEALASNIDEVNAMTLATADPAGKPSARIVLLKGLKREGFEFFTNYESHKALEMAANDHVALVFFWKELQRQVRIEGTVSKTTSSVSDEYFNSRPRESRIGAWSSPQSHTIPSREMLDERVTASEKRFEGKEEIPRPDFWGGYIVNPRKIEFWQGRPNRLHDRIEYVLENGGWIKKRLAP